MRKKELAKAERALAKAQANLAEFRRELRPRFGRRPAASSKRRARVPAAPEPTGEHPALRAMQARRGSSQQAEGQGADPPYPKGGGPASSLACVAQPVVYEEEIDGPVPPVLTRLYLRDGLLPRVGRPPCGRSRAPPPSDIVLAIRSDKYA